MSVRRKLGAVAVAASVCGLGMFQTSAWAQKAASPQTALTDTPVAPPNTEAMRVAGIRKDNSRHFGSDPDDPGPLAKDLSPAMTKAAIGAAMKKVGDWQLAESQKYFSVVQKPLLDGRIWTWSALYVGYLAAADALHDTEYRDAVYDMGKSYDWGLRSKLPGADDQSLGQAYEELYFIYKQPEMIAPTRAALDAVMAEPRVELGSGRKIAWWWCDSLFMAPPTWVRMYAATKDMKYVNYLDEEWAKTSKLLYDPTEHLYWRDASFIGKKEKNGKDLFWSRGQGWVMAGLARTLEYLPKDDPARPMYILQLQQMAAAVKKLQQPDGLWTSGMMDPQAYGMPEISGSSLMTYGMAWGINNGFLDRKTYEPVVRRAWAGMLKHVYADGRLGCIQQTGAQPTTFKASASYTYGVGGFLLAGSELIKMSEREHGGMGHSKTGHAAKK